MAETPIYVYSTLSSDVAYTNHASGGGGLPIALPAVVINGGAGVANDRFVTPRGVVTTITREQADYLSQNPVFQMHKENGYVQISEGYADPESAAADMTGRDVSAPLVPQDNLTSGALKDATVVVGGVPVEGESKAGKRR